MKIHSNKIHRLISISIAIMLVIVNCRRSAKSPDDFISTYRSHILAAEDSLLGSTADSSACNALLASLVSTSEWKVNQQYFQSDPFYKEILIQSDTEAKDKQQPDSKTSGKEKAVVKKEPVLSGIIEIGSVKKALIDGELYKVGEKIRNSELIEIGNKYITLKNTTGTHKLYLKEKSK